jgi:hypothetical protein
MLQSRTEGRIYRFLALHGMAEFPATLLWTQRPARGVGSLFWMRFLLAGPHAIHLAIPKSYSGSACKYTESDSFEHALPSLVAM